MKILSAALIMFVSLILSACSQAGFALVNAPANFSAVERYTDIAYGDGDLNTLDVYTPANAASAPVIFFIHGGRWSEGNKDQYKFVGDRLARAGYMVVIPDYRKYPSVKFPALMEDEADALAWVYANIAEYGGQCEQLNIMGHSSGAHVGALLVADERYLNARGVPLSAIKRFVGLSGPYHFTPDEPDLTDMFGPPERYPQMQVTTFIDGGEPPMLLIWGAQDDVVGKINIEQVAPVIAEKGASVEVKVYDTLDHTGTIKAFTWLFENKSSLLKDVLAFLNQ